ncbi:sirohydrochlorin chelatase [Heyndrickxia coagulans]|nr:sirohydrochlorin chelatase [Heyndrickxia coagulans]AJH78826.1 cbiX family protein [Heyndrickxia coagulans DSM 1 = ATCC 7050]MBF8417321.1 sirohydrochlorin chelatase [Heyndrickxia coagulans]MCR2847656.1 sirohydrochlorin chelatase [Heyndrickxia coagulans]MDR4225403.1 sirohydrochlorin chelatase [Heyndrickxia coagulans DSM 1 = ATCC 7050]MED4493000.1 sirohydrochlorin chelatase [Heyndrickxia coagulans]
MKQGVLYVSHGSRVPETAREATAAIRQAMAQVDADLQEICYLEIAEPDIAAGIDALVRGGAGRIAVVPVLLLSAGHYYEDIPRAIREAKRRYPHIVFTYGRPLGVGDRITGILAENILETGMPPGAWILLVGRGSRNPETLCDFAKIADGLRVQLGAEQIKTAYLAVLEPRFDEALKELAVAGRPVVVAPYLWFTGVLVRSLEKKVGMLQREGYDIRLARYLGCHPDMADALAGRAKEALGAEAFI